MKYTDYLQDVERTWNKQSKEQDRKHIMLGLVDECGEIASALKKHIGYGNEIDKVNILEECGDYLYFLSKRIVEFNKFPLEDLEYLNEVVPSKAKLPRKEDIDFYETFLSMEFMRYQLFFNQGCQNIAYVVTIIETVRIFLHAFDYTLEDCIQRNVAKREARFPRGYEQTKAIERDLKNERKILEA